MGLVTASQHGTFRTAVDVQIKRIAIRNNLPVENATELSGLQTDLSDLDKLYNEANQLIAQLRMLLHHYQEKKQITRLKLKEAKAKLLK